MALDFSKISHDSRIRKTMKRLLDLIPTDTIVPIFQGPAKGLKWKVGASEHGCYFGSYVIEVQRFLETTLNPGNVFYDLGAHAGFFTLLASKKLGKQGKVYAFEPNPKNRSILEEHIRINKLNNVVILDMAVGNENSFVYLKEECEKGEGSYVSNQGDFRVKMVRLDDMISSNSIEIPQMIKINIEGSELEALKGGSNLLATHHPALAIFTHDICLKEACREFLVEMDYELSYASYANNIDYIILAI